MTKFADILLRLVGVFFLIAAFNSLSTIGALKLIGLTFVLTTALWLAYILVMRLKAWRERKQRPLWQKVIIYTALGPVAVLGLLADILHNYTFTVLLLLSFPPELKFTITARLQYYREELIATNWRERWQVNAARWICERLLNKYDPDGKHC